MSPPCLARSLRAPRLDLLGGPPNKRLKLRGALVGGIALPRRLAFLSAAPTPYAGGQRARSLSAIR